jgi:hypothetical protein
MSLLLLLRPLDSVANVHAGWAWDERKRPKLRKKPLRDVGEDLRATIAEFLDEKPKPVEVEIPEVAQYAARAIESLPGADFAAIRARVADVEALLARMLAEKRWREQIEDEVRRLAQMEEEDEQLLLMLM